MAAGVTLLARAAARSHVVLGVAPAGALAGVSPRALFESELTIAGAFGPEAAFTRALQWLPALELAPLVTHVFPLEDVGTAIATARSGDCGKVLFAPGPTWYAHQDRCTGIRISVNTVRSGGRGTAT